MGQPMIIRFDGLPPAPKCYRKIKGRYVGCPLNRDLSAIMMSYEKYIIQI
jgi:hypothetical protein